MIQTINQLKRRLWSEEETLDNLIAAKEHAEIAVDRQAAMVEDVRNEIALLQMRYNINRANERAILAKLEPTVIEFETTA